VSVFWLDREEALRRLRRRAGYLGQARPEVKRVVLFGSLAEGKAVPGSDADILIIIEALPGEAERQLDRPLHYLPFFEGVGIAVDLFCYTPEEAERLPFVRRALGKSIVLWEK